MIIKVPIAYVKLDKQGVIFDKRALISMAKNTRLPIYVYPDFNQNSTPIGIVTVLEEKNNKLEAAIEILQPVKGWQYTKEDFKDSCFRVFGISNSEKNIKGVTSIMDFSLLGVGVVPKNKDVYNEENL